MAKLNFNPQSADKREERGAMPAGEYMFSITESELKAGRKPGSQVLGLTYTCLQDGFKGRKMWQYLNIVNPSADAQRIAQSELREICEAAGLGNQVLDDSVKLHNVPMLVKIKIEKDDIGQYDDKNKPVAWKPASAAQGAAPGGFRPPVATPASPASFKASVATPAPAAGPSQPAQAPAQQSLADTAADSTTGTTTSPSEPPAAQPAAEQPAGRPTPPWMKRAS